MPEFKTFDQIEPAQGISCLLYGQSKTGKTDLAGSAGENSLYIDIGKSSETFHGASFKSRRGPYKGLYVQVREIGGKDNYIMPDNAKAYDEVCDIIDEALIKYPHIETIILDELTAMSRFALFKALEVNSSTGKSKANETSKKWDIPLPTKQDFGGEMSFIKMFLAGTVDILKAQGKHLIVVAHERWLFETMINNKGEKVETDRVIKILPSFTGKKDIDAIPNLFDLVWHTEVARSGDTLVYRVKTTGDDVLVAGTRYGGIFNALETNMSWLDIVKRIKDGVSVKK